MTDLREADVVGTEVANGESRLTLGRSNGDGLASGVAAWGPLHYYAVPNPKNDNGACGALLIQDSNRLRAIAYRDNRYSGSAGDLQPGDYMFASRGEARIIHKAEQDSLTIYTVNKKTGLSIMVHVDAEEGVVQIVNGNSRYEQLDKSITQAVNGGGSIVCDEDGVHISGTNINLDGGCVTAGLNVGGTRPQPVVDAALTGNPLAPFPSTTVVIAK